MDTEATSYDYGEDAAPEAPTEDTLKAIHLYVHQLDEAEREVAECEAKLKAAQRRAADLREHKIPELMASIKSKSWETEDGIKVEIEREWKCRLPKEDEERRAKAIAWMDANGYGSLVNRKYVIEFTKDQEARARKVKANLLRYKDALPMEEILDVHPSTLAKMVREVYAEGKELPEEVFKPYESKRAKIKRRG